VNIYTYISVIKAYLVSGGGGLLGSIPQDLVLHDISRHTSHSIVITYLISLLLAKDGGKKIEGPDTG
jgi:hypothetical protein